ncbi:dihydrolipoamide acetyltransferase family protein [Marihabitans asiaticum]|uniref:Dihydrolipoamide acetyltransferase component of pyruvate dehydrogenase complex n=1 Tax=Marihabitans asiaticum TaxID=415218 RepID=A0A560WEH2_9MICO|nr:dihydrolipoamide acetyltransferase family protein [Marihabitans asiaticum]TWD15885.1 pyruvate dehydrogenase E2 component (dihydrolipoamide acetyltransferase) [Marihabitans asiaticum]
MAMQKFNLPDPGEGLTEADLVTWRVAVGDEVKVNDMVVEVETAKSLVELPIPFAGTVVELLASEGDTVEVGSPIIVIDTGGDAPADPDGGSAESGESGQTPSSEGGDESSGPNLVGYGAKAGSTKRRARRGGAKGAAQPGPAGDSPEAGAEPQAAPPTPSPDPERAPEQATGERARALAKPPVRKLAKDLGVDLASITPTGDGGVVTREDVQAAASASPADGGSSQDSQRTASRAGDAPEQTRVPIKGVRKRTAEAMVASAFTAPHVTEFITVDVTATMELVERLKGDKAFRDTKVTPLLVVAKALCLAIRRNPEVNASWDEDAQEIVYSRDVNLGIAAATPRGLVVPNIKAADAMSMRELADAMAELVATAREGKTTPADFAGGTVTITNVGVFGVDTGTPILNPGEAAILAFGAVRRQPWVVQRDGVESIEPRWVTQLALSFDHRLVDGELGSKVLADLAALLHDPGQALVWA